MHPDDTHATRTDRALGRRRAAAQGCTSRGPIPCRHPSSAARRRTAVTRTPPGPSARAPGWRPRIGVRTRRNRAPCGWAGRRQRARERAEALVEHDSARRRLAARPASAWPPPQRSARRPHQLFPLPETSVITWDSSNKSRSGPDSTWLTTPSSMSTRTARARKDATLDTDAPLPSTNDSTSRGTL